MPTYAYNAPRPAFDNLLDQRADELGARRVRDARQNRARRTRTACGWRPKLWNRRRGWAASSRI